MSLADLAVAIERDDRALVLFMNAVGYGTCEVRSAGPNREPSGGGATEPCRTATGYLGRCNDFC